MKKHHMPRRVIHVGSIRRLVPNRNHAKVKLTMPVAPKGGRSRHALARASAVRTALADVADAFLLARLFHSHRLRRQLQNGGLLAFA